jgi:hypothetical protein
VESVDSNSVVRRGVSISLQQLHNSICEESASRERPNSIFRQVFALVTITPLLFPLTPSYWQPLSVFENLRICEHSFIEFTQFFVTCKSTVLKYFVPGNPEES